MSPFNPFSFPPQFPLQLLSFQTDLSIFASPSILQPSQSFHQLSDKLCLTSYTCLSSFSLFSQPSVLHFPSDCSQSRLSPLLLAYFVCLALFHSHSPTLPLSAKALRGPIRFSGLMSIPTLYTWADWTVQVVQGRTQTHTHTRWI